MLVSVWIIPFFSGVDSGESAQLLVLIARSNDYIIAFLLFSRLPSLDAFLSRTSRFYVAFVVFRFDL